MSFLVPISITKSMINDKVLFHGFNLTLNVNELNGNKAQIPDSENSVTKKESIDNFWLRY